MNWIFVSSGHDMKSQRKLACIPCRRRKKKCGKEYPACSFCALWGIECHYSLLNSRSHIHRKDSANRYPHDMHAQSFSAQKPTEEACKKNVPTQSNTPTEMTSTEAALISEPLEQTILPLWTPEFFRIARAKLKCS